MRQILAAGRLRYLFYVFVCLDGEGRAHPNTNTAGSAVVRMRENSEWRALGVEFILFYLDAVLRAKFDAVSTSFTKIVTDYYLALGHGATKLSMQNKRLAMGNLTTGTTGPVQWLNHYPESAYLAAPV